MIRPATSTDITAGSHVQAELREALEAQVPAGHQLTDARVEMVKRSTELIGHGRYRSTEVREIEADDRDALDALVPDGWQLLSVRIV
ncbi:hypothetical protein N8K70_04055 [Microbacterium betulae]|uniref:Uncharacterized protein n=1 Tax=Microbacterium betulae TaxID=2981139 RepID=A0AA97I7V5_9MICO|nr:hypothetical protein [Microbacterium sp. AB]WOF23865.1 hypothetical protein N8K70_04055 [Microbacterium sp. AB]